LRVIIFGKRGNRGQGKLLEGRPGRVGSKDFPTSRVTHKPWELGRDKEGRVLQKETGSLGWAMSMGNTPIS